MNKLESAQEWTVEDWTRLQDSYLVSHGDFPVGTAATQKDADSFIAEHKRSLSRALSSLREERDRLLKEVEERRKVMADIVRTIGHGRDGLAHDELEPMIASILTCRDHWKISFESERKNVIRLRGLLADQHAVNFEQRSGECSCRDCLLVRNHQTPPSGEEAESLGKEYRLGVEQVAERIRALLKDRSKGEVETWGFVAMFLDMVEQAKLELIEKSSSLGIKEPASDNVNAVLQKAGAKNACQHIIAYANENDAHPCPVCELSAWRAEHKDLSAKLVDLQVSLAMIDGVMQDVADGREPNKELRKFVLPQLKKHRSQISAIQQRHGHLKKSSVPEPDAVGALPVSKEPLPLRLYDLVRYIRSELHQAKLITDDEYAEICQWKEGAASARRLEDYDSLRSRLRIQTEALKEIVKRGSQMDDDGGYASASAITRIARSALAQTEPAKHGFLSGGNAKGSAAFQKQEES